MDQSALASALDSWLAATLSITAIMLGVLALMLGVMAFWGYGAIKRDAKLAAEAAAMAKLDEYLSSQEIGDKLKAAIDGRVASEADALFEDFALRLQLPSEDDASGTVGDAYPNEPNGPTTNT